MGSLSNYLELEILDHICKTGAYTAPTNIYIGLSTADPTEDGSGIAEPSTGSYARVACNAWNVAASGATANTNAITFPTSSAAWSGGSNLTHFFASDASSGGNMLWYGALGTAFAVGAAGVTPSFAAGDLDITLT